MHKDISMVVRFSRDDAHRTVPPKYHIGTSSKRRPEAARAGGRHEGSKVDDEMGITYLRCSTREISPTDMNEQTRRSLQFFDDVLDRRHELMNC